MSKKRGEIKGARVDLSAIYRLHAPAAGAFTWMKYACISCNALQLPVVLFWGRGLLYLSAWTRMRR